MLTGREIKSEDIANVLCGSLLEDISSNDDRRKIKEAAKRTSQIFVNMEENILSAKEKEERIRQTMDACEIEGGGLKVAWEKKNLRTEQNTKLQKTKR